MKNKNLIILFYIFWLVFISYLNLNFTNKKSEVYITIKRGMSVSGISHVLKSNNVIKNESLFKLAVKFMSAGSKLRAGKYKFTTNEYNVNIINSLLKGSNIPVKITIPEGFTADEVIRRLYENGIGSYTIYKNIISKNNLEGYLYPETYYFDASLREEQVLKIMTNQFHKEIDPILSSYDFSKFKNKKYSFGTNEVIILASLIEKEAKLDEERSFISAVFHNRLRKNWYLESCASVQYALPHKKDKLTYKDLDIDSPYNTYKHLGLPKGPICNPGKKSIISAIMPANSDIMFFVRDKNNDDGAHIFSKYYESHLMAKKKKNIKTSK